MAQPNDALLELRDIHAAPPPAWWPPAPGWWLLGLLLLLCLLAFAQRLRRYQRQRQRRRAVLAMLGKLRNDCRGVAFAAEVSVLLRRAALERFAGSDTAIAALQGEQWLAFLDRTGGLGRFRHGPGRALAEAAYRPQADIDEDGLYRLAHHWLKCNL